MMIRVFDFCASLVGIIFLFPLGVLLFIAGLFDTGSPIFYQERMGKDQKKFILIKFRTMHKKTAQVASHLADKGAVTKYGAFLRKTKLDELPQLLNVLCGDMSLVGARPNLFSQLELIEERKKRGVYNYLPGITGLSQINEIDMSTPKLLAETDAIMYRELSFRKYLYYIIVTIGGKGQGDRIK
ncbi:lipid carrier : UDP-N-acetylgalactosaminyltransferase [Porphyromonas gingivicanis]|uniref:Lipid carrier: UDP-N-acetylgalactosaminyltransferase n=1 Tax=Porphyromonas gingivicanis TaxID=266762 RepID=A0A0A2GD06_9PORP|nr:sugar transferase [Porphyromonas gingivicanis]KGN98309.1 lipid carrier : UDP-N-acetylgalactosaminyltransferase [Porphyromonas gingivicanis]